MPTMRLDLVVRTKTPTSLFYTTLVSKSTEFDTVRLDRNVSLQSIIARHNKVLFVGCGTCVAVCLAGGEREVGIASYAMRMARKTEGKPLDLTQITIERKCESEFINDWRPAWHAGARKIVREEHRV
jgi:ferredoxin